MKRGASSVLLVLSACLMEGSAYAQKAGDIQGGLTLAMQVCSECHAIQAQQSRSPNAGSPTFADIANTPGMTETGLTVALTTPHAGMPMFRLTADQRRDIIAYILSPRPDDPQPGR